MENKEVDLNHEGAPPTGTENHYRNLFEYAPISLWEEDYSLIKEYLDGLRQQPIPNDDLYSYIQIHPEIINECVSRIRVINVNQKTLEMYAAASKEEIISNMGKIVGSETPKNFTQDLVDLWIGKYVGEREGINYTLVKEVMG